MDQFIEFITNHLILSSLWLFLFGLLVASWMRSAGKVKNLSSQQVTDLINREDAVVIDIRNAKDFKKGHVVSSRNLSLKDLENVDKTLEKEKQNPIIVVCNTGMQAGNACAALSKQGFERVYRLHGGIQTWISDGMPLAK